MVNKTITYIKQYFFMLALAATFVGFSAFKYANPTKHANSIFYELQADGTIGAQLQENDADCSEPSGPYCSVELSEQKPNDMVDITDAESSSIWVETYHRE